MVFPLQFLLETALPHFLMSSDKKKKHSKKDQTSANVLDLAQLTLKKFRKVTKEVGKLSTGQKLLGGVALAAAGLAYLAARDAEETPDTAAADTPQALAADHAPAAASRKHPKRPRFAAEE